MIETLTQEDLQRKKPSTLTDKGKTGYLVIGAGRMGYAVIYDLIRSIKHQIISVVDNSERALRRIKDEFPEVQTYHLNIDGNPGQFEELMSQCAVAIGCVSYTSNVYLTRVAIENGCHFIDLGGNMNIVKLQKEFHSEARKAGVSIIPNCGLAPGLANIIAAGGSGEFEELESIKMRVGGLPQNPLNPPLNYGLVFSAEGLINEYLGESEIIKDGEVTTANSLTGLEKVFPFKLRHQNIDRELEAFHTSGGTSMLPDMLRGNVINLDYKTIRFTGHCKEINRLFSIYSDRDELSEILARKIDLDIPDFTLFRVEIIGWLGTQRRKHRYECVDYQKGHMSSMMRMTAFPTAIIANMILTGEISLRGVYTAEDCGIPLDKMVDQLNQRDIHIEKFVEWV